MAELVKETNHEEMRDDDGEFDNVKDSNPGYLIELNLLITALSLVNPISSEDYYLNYGERETGNFKDQGDQQACVSKLHSRRHHDIHEFKLAGRRAQTFQPMIKDCRHGRRM